MPHDDILKREVESLSERGMNIELVEVSGQRYTLVNGMEAPAPPWDRTSYDILIAVPIAYEDGGLDGFYLGLPYGFNGTTHPRVNGGTIEINGRQWRAVSWHYPDNAPWQRGRDNLEGHISHCKGFFLHRGAVNAY